MVRRVQVETAEMEAQPRNVGGAPSKYIARLFPKQANMLARRGATQAEIAKFFDVTTTTLQNWIMQYPEMQEAISTGNEVFDPRVERALAERALGFWVDVPVWKTEDGKLREVIEHRYFPPDTTAGIYWTKNRMPDRWRDVHKVDVNSNVLQSSESLRQALLLEFKDLVDQGLLQLPTSGRKMKVIEHDQE